MGVKRVDVGSGCNNHCWFCPSDKNKFKSFDEIKEEVNKISETSGLVVLTGGEPTIHPKIFEIISYLNQDFDEVSLLTNGRAFSYPSFCKEIINNHIDVVFIKINGHTKQVHDPLTTVDGSFDQTVKGIKNLVGLGVVVNCCVNITEQNFIFLPKIADFLNGLGVNEIHLSLPKPTGRGLENFEKLTPRFIEIKKSILDTIEKNKDKTFIEGIPLCFLKGQEDRITTPAKDEQKVKIDACNKCTKKEDCSGIWSEYVKIYGESEIKPFLDSPTEIAIEVTSKCNLDCGFCFNKNYYDKENPVEPSLDKVKAIIDKIPVDFVSQLRFTGGEPLLRKDIFEILDYAKSKGFTIWFNTNGILVTKGTAEKLAKYVDNVLLPIDSYDEESEFKLTGKRHFKAKLDAIRLLKDAGIKTVRAGTVATKENIENLEKFYSIVLKSELDDWELYRQIPTKENKNPLTNEDIKLLADKLLALNESFDKEFSIVNALPFCSYDTDKMSKVVKGNESDDGHIRFVIGADGNARPSYYLNYKIGNINENTVEEIWNNKFMKDMRELKLVPDNCKTCEYLKKCKGGSRFVAELVGLSYSGMDPLSDLKNV